MSYLYTNFWHFCLYFANDGRWQVCVPSVAGCIFFLYFFLAKCFYSTYGCTIRCYMLFIQSFRLLWVGVRSYLYTLYIRVMASDIKVARTFASNIKFINKKGIQRMNIRRYRLIIYSIHGKQIFQNGKLVSEFFNK